MRILPLWFRSGWWLRSKVRLLEQQLQAQSERHADEMGKLRDRLQARIDKAELENDAMGEALINVRAWLEANTAVAKKVSDLMGYPQGRKPDGSPNGYAGQNGQGRGGRQNAM